MPVSDALAAVLAGAEPLAEEAVALDQAFHRVLARDSPSATSRSPPA
jgi:molybdopterin molybdotransferase